MKWNCSAEFYVNAVDIGHKTDSSTVEIKN